MKHIRMNAIIAAVGLAVMLLLSAQSQAVSMEFSFRPEYVSAVLLAEKDDYPLVQNETGQWYIDHANKLHYAGVISGYLIGSECPWPTGDSTKEAIRKIAWDIAKSWPDPELFLHMEMDIDRAHTVIAMSINNVYGCK
jgi:hypothetical protein